MGQTKKSPEQIAEELSKGYKKPFTAFGQEWQGDIFYSAIHLETKKMSHYDFQKVCDILREKGYYIHS